MAATLEDIKAIREIHSELIEAQLPIFQEMESRAQTLADFVSDKVQTFAASADVCYKVGQHIDQPASPIRKLQYVRRAIYKNSAIVTLFRTDTFSKMYIVQADAKSLYTGLWTEIAGDEQTLLYLTTNADKERECEYMLRNIAKHIDKIKTLYTTARTEVDWIADNLDQLNKVESALRLEHNMQLTLNDVGSDGLGDLEHSEEGVDLDDLDSIDISPKSRIPTAQGSNAVMELQEDDLDNLGTHEDHDSGKPEPEYSADERATASENEHRRETQHESSDTAAFDDLDTDELA